MGAIGRPFARSTVAGGVDTGAERGEGAAGIGGGEQAGQSGGLDELDTGDLVAGQADLCDPVVVPGTAVEDMHDLAWKPHGRGCAEAVGGDPVDGQAPLGHGGDAELLHHLARGGVSG